MSRDLELLVPEFRNLAKQVIKNTGDRGYEVRPFFTERSVYTQAKLWRQSRTTMEVRKAADRLIHEQAEFLAKVLIEVGAQHGRWATNALPGQSWHNWGEALDCFVAGEDGRAVWTAKNAGYLVYAEEAKKLGLVSGYWWKRKDAVHIQFRSEGVRASKTWPEINESMMERYMQAS